MSNNPTLTQAWQDLAAHKKTIENTSIADMFAKDQNRFANMSVETNNCLFDYSKHLATDETIDLLCELAKAQGVETKRASMFAGKKINITENRAVLHTALRDMEDRGIKVDDEETFPFKESILKKMEAFGSAITNGDWTGFTGKKIDTIVSIGIGGSHLGPDLVVDALRPYVIEGRKTHFVANIDGADLDKTLAAINPETTLFIVASKTFTTQETMENAKAAKAWLIQKLDSSACVEKHFVALSTNTKGVTEFGIHPDNMFEFKDWVGGRFSLWSAIGLSIVLSIGYKNFADLLAGAYAADTHFKEAPLNANIPVIMALLGVWYRNFWDAQTHAILPYAEDLALLPLFLQQLDMESNGKSVDLDNQPITDYETAPVIFGQAGTNGQHAFYQMLHHGTTIVPVDFIGAAKPHHNFDNHNALLLNNMLAQSQALMNGRSLEEAGGNMHRVFSGNRPSSTLIFDQLTPYTLGMLIAFYEHKIFVQGVIWNINSFDQFGVELGKELAKKLEKGESDNLDASTQGLMDYIAKS